MPLAQLIDSQLAEDYFLTTGVALADGSPSPVAVFVNASGQTEAAVVHEDNTLYHVCREPQSSSGWNAYQAGARFGTGLAIADANTAWGTDNLGALWVWNAGHWTKDSYPMPDQALIANSGYDRTLWSLDGNEVLYQYSAQSGWAAVAGAPQNVRAVSGGANNLWIADQFGKITNLVNGSRTVYPLPGGAVGNSISASSDGAVWVADENGVLYQLSGGAFETVAAPGAVDVIGAVTGGGLWMVYTANSETLIGLQTPGAALQAVALPTGIYGEELTAAFGVDGTILLLDYSMLPWICNATAGNWQRMIVPTGMAGFTSAGGVTEVVAGQDSNGNNVLAFVQSGTVYVAQFGYGNWQQPQSVGAGSFVGLTNHLVTNELIGYGTSGSGDFLVYRQSTGYAEEVYQGQRGGMLAGVKTNLTVRDDQNWFSSCVIGGVVYMGYGNSSAPLYNPNLEENEFVPMADTNNVNFPNYFPSNLQEIIRLPWTQSTQQPYAAAIDTSGSVWMIYNMEAAASIYLVVSAGSFIQVGGGNNALPSSMNQVGAIIDTDNMAWLYATDSSDRVWVLRQTGSAGPASKPFTWTMWHPLGNYGSYLANGPASVATSEIYGVDLNHNLTLLRQDPVTLSWKAVPINRPAGTGEDTDHVSRYRTEVSVLDENNNPVPNQPVTVSVTEPATLWLNGQLQTLSAGVSVTANTGAFGRLYISAPALGLHSPALTIQTQGLQPSSPVYGPQHFRDFLSGVAQRNGALFSWQSLTDATDSLGNSFSLAPGLQDSLAQTVAAIIPQISSQTPSTATEDDLARLAAVRASHKAARALGSWDSFWDELENYADDVYEAIRNGILTVVSATFNATTRFFQLTLEIVETGIQDTLTFLIDTAQHIADALHSVFAWIEAEVDTIVNWLRALFDLHAIENTKKVFSYFVGRMFPFLQGVIQNDATPIVQGFFQGIETDVNGGFAFLRQQLLGKTVSNVGSNPSMNSNLQLPSGLSFQPGQFLLGTEVNWLLEKAESYLFGSSSDMLNPVALVQQAANELWTGASAALNDFLTALQSLESFVENSVQKPGDFTALEASDLLTAAQETIDGALTFADAIINALLDLVNAALNAVGEVLTKSIHIPIFSKLFGSVSALDIFSLLIAFPVTIAYKLVNGSGSELFTDQQVLEITGGSGATRRLGEDPGLVTAFEFCSAGVVLVWSVFDTILDLFKQAPPLALQIVDVIGPTLVQIFEWPSGVPFTSIPTDTAAEKWALGFWCTGFASLCMNIGLLVAGQIFDGQTKVGRYIDPVGKGILTAIGLVSLGVGATASGLGHKAGTLSGAAIAANSLSPMSTLFQWLRLESVADSTDELTFILKPVVDFFTGAGTAVALFVSTDSEAASA